MTRRSKADIEAAIAHERYVDHLMRLRDEALEAELPQGYTIEELPYLTWSPTGVASGGQTSVTVLLFEGEMILTTNLPSRAVYAAQQTVGEKRVLEGQEAML